MLARPDVAPTDFSLEEIEAKVLSNIIQNHPTSILVILVVSALPCLRVRMSEDAVLAHFQDLKVMEEELRLREVLEANCMKGFFQVEKW